ncbi:MAG: FAD-binding protein [Marmoricola sp.]|nr:FAD-binding protein [Marmoricola sp.]
MGLLQAESAPWTNWVGNQTSHPAFRASPRDEEEVATLVRQAADRGIGVRVAGAGHSFTPVVATDGLHLDLSAMRGVVATDRARQRVTALPGTRIHDFYEPLWDAGLALRNQGDIDTQHIAGAVATSTHGSGTRFTSLSGAVRSMRVVTGSGEVLEIGEDQPDLLHAAQTSVGMLGVVTQLELAVTDAYRLRQDVGLRSFEDVMEHWDQLVAEHRHFGMFWLPSEASGALYNLDGHGQPMADQCYVKVYDEVGPEVPDSDLEGHRVDRCYRIFPMVYDANFHELEYFVPLDRGPDAVRAMRELMLARLPDSVYPLEVRTVGADEAWLSPQHRQDTTVISVSGGPGTDYWDYLRSVDALLADFDARPHWGKLHFSTRERIQRLLPRAADFVALRRELDPAGTFLNDHLRPLFG